VFFLELMINGAIQGLVIGLAALAVTLVFGIARFANAAAGDTATVGAFAALLGFQATQSLLLGAIAAILVTAIVSVLGYFLVFRPLSGRPAVALLVSSIGFGFVIRSILGITFGHGQHLFQVRLERPWILFDTIRVAPMDLRLAGAAFGALAILFLILYRTPIGREMRAVADDRDLARVSGILPDRVLVSMWLLAGAVSGTAGMMIGIKTVVTPEIGWELLLPAFAAAVLGGIGSPAGAVLAGLLLGVAQEISTPIVGFTYKIALSFVVLLVVLLIRPRGLFGRVEGAR